MGVEVFPDCQPVDSSIISINYTAESEGSDELPLVPRTVLGQRPKNVVQQVMNGSQRTLRSVI